MAAEDGSNGAWYGEIESCSYGTALRQRRTCKLTIERSSKFDIQCLLRYSHVSLIIDSLIYLLEASM